MLMRKALEERFHVEFVIQSLLLLVAAGRHKKLLVGVEQAGKAPDECGTDLIRMESGVTHQTDLGCAAVVHSQFAR